MEKDKVKILERIEEEAIDMLDSFKEHPIKSIFISIVVLWGIRKIYEIIRGE